MKEYIAEYIVPVEKKGNDCMFDFMNAKRLIRCRDCKYWKQTEEGIGECVMFNSGDYRYRSTAGFFCNMADPKENG